MEQSVEQNMEQNMEQSVAQSMEETNAVTTQFDGIISSISLFRNQLTALQQQLRLLQRAVTKEVNTLKKESIKKKAKGSRKPSGFAKP